MRALWLRSPLQHPPVWPSTPRATGRLASVKAGVWSHVCVQGAGQGLGAESSHPRLGSQTPLCPPACMWLLSWLPGRCSSVERRGGDTRGIRQIRGSVWLGLCRRTFPVSEVRFTCARMNRSRFLV
ncbi:Homeobox Protein Notochord [Manis pentadactyla]|nr:Homeobox Protein Notochord [Manis pentadactyla]